MKKNLIALVLSLALAGLPLASVHSEGDLVIPTVATEAPTSVTAIGAIFHGTVVDLGGAATVTTGFQLGLSPGAYYFGMMMVDGPNLLAAPGPFIAAAMGSGLQCGTQYYFRMAAGNTAGTGYGEEMTFTTLVCPPGVTTLPATGITQTSAVLQANVTGTGGLLVHRDFVFGTTTGYGTPYDIDTDFTGSTGPYSAPLTGLLCGTEYHYMAHFTASNSEIAQGADQMFATLPCTEPALAVTSPNGGELYTVGDVMHITWNSTDIDSEDAIALLIKDSRYPEDPTGIQPIAAAPNTGSYDWTVPASLDLLSGGTLGGNSAYTISAVHIGEEGTTEDASDAPFTIAVREGTTTGGGTTGGATNGQGTTGESTGGGSGTTGNGTTGEGTTGSETTGSATGNGGTGGTGTSNGRGTIGTGTTGSATGGSGTTGTGTTGGTTGEGANGAGTTGNGTGTNIVVARAAGTGGAAEAADTLITPTSEQTALASQAANALGSGIFGGGKPWPWLLGIFILLLLAYISRKEYIKAKKKKNSAA